ncbi:MAG: FHA domain-containing protein [Propionibacteriaceae bacterium]|nr:FHA domain-containing protein [Propionibacteriaceae bacterium]
MRQLIPAGLRRRVLTRLFGRANSDPSNDPTEPMPAANPVWQPQQPVPPTTPSPSRPVPQWIPLPTPTSVIGPSVKAGTVEGRGGGEGWYLRLDDGREVELNVTVLLGRNPQKGPDDPEVHLVPASGDGRMISRTHVLIGTDPRGVFVVDRGSTNGTALVTAAGVLEPSPAGVQTRVGEGRQVSYGNRWFTVLRRDAV